MSDSKNELICRFKEELFAPVRWSNLITFRLNIIKIQEHTKQFPVNLNCYVIKYFGILKRIALEGYQKQSCFIYFYLEFRDLTLFFIIFMMTLSIGKQVHHETDFDFGVTPS